VKIHEIDLMTDDLPARNYDFAWCRWVISFVSDPALLIRKLARVMPKASLSIFHEYGHYETWKFFRDCQCNGFVIRSARPQVFCLRPSDYMWQWPATFIKIYLPRLIEMGRTD
jgi:hypothetical protein